jgi:hypothetical protein
MKTAALQTLALLLDDPVTNIYYADDMPMGGTYGFETDQDQEDL